MRTIVSVRDETPTVRTLEFADGALAGALAGQFVMVWVPGKGELPMSIMVSETAGHAALTVRTHGPSSRALYSTPVGGLVGIRGPYGNSFGVRGRNVLLAGGGTGLVPLMRLIAQSPPDARITLAMGARTAEEVFFEEIAARLAGPRSLEVVVATDDGTRGEAGTVVDAVGRILESGSFDSAHTCGPEPMMRGVVDAARSRGVFVQASIERVMKCGVGICGSCAMDASLVCCDGTVLDGERLAASGEFGRTYRSKSGVRTPY